jgi:predicted small lipoprotein YifL
MKLAALHLILALFTIRAACGLAAGLSMPEAVVEADVIAHIRVVDDVEVVPDSITKRDGNTLTVSMNIEKLGEYRHVATAKLVETFKGAAGEKTIEIRHTNGFGCPNVHYKNGDDCLVFLRKEPGTDRYVTMNFYAGKFPIEDGGVRGFYIMPNFVREKDSILPYARVAAFLTEAVREHGKSAKAKTGTSAGGKGK